MPGTSGRRPRPLAVPVAACPWRPAHWQSTRMGTVKAVLTVAAAAARLPGPPAGRATGRPCRLGVPRRTGSMMRVVPDRASV
jgi:hypothetical protein